MIWTNAWTSLLLEPYCIQTRIDVSMFKITEKTLIYKEKRFYILSKLLISNKEMISLPVCGIYRIPNPIVEHMLGKQCGLKPGLEFRLRVFQ